ncbi:MAG: methyltransferase [Gammaproteobacteria bacterium]|nr:methyltransferase [Gammaproteobacteria bacterium]MCF6231465.1 methyltransferase [Gammaproteobacteria bacterium]
MNQDNALSLLLNTLQNEREASLWVADEHTPDTLPIPLNPIVDVISNRFDVVESLTRQGWSSRFSDLDFSHLHDSSLATVYFRLAKERAVVNRVINQASRVLKAGGRLIICGGKQQGIKNYAKQAAQCLAGEVKIKKQGNHYLATITRGQQPATLLDDKQYSTLRTLQQYGDIDITSKPGQFGWNKLDNGSLLLAEQFKQLEIEKPETILDLGCGYGFLSLAAHRQWPDAVITATDNNAAALLSCRENFTKQAITGDVIADNCASKITQQQDIVLCNPPFHQGFSVDSSLTEQFVASAKRLCKPTGCALFVVNAFIPLERIAKKHFKQQPLLLNDGHFKLFKLYDTGQTDAPPIDAGRGRSGSKKYPTESATSPLRY